MASPASFDPRLGRTLGDPRGMARRIQELERRMARLESTVGPPGRRVYWSELSGPWSSTSPPAGSSGITFDIAVPGVYLCFVQFTAYTTTAGLMTKELWIDDTLENSTGQYINTLSEHTTIAIEAGFREFDAASHTLKIRWAGTGATSDTNDRASFYAVRTS